MVSMDVLGVEVRRPAGVLAELFDRDRDRDRELAVSLNRALRRLSVANERLTVVMPVGAVLCALAGPTSADFGLTGRPAVLEAESPVAALGEAADAIRGAMFDYQSIAEERRQLAADIGEATIRLVDALTAIGLATRRRATLTCGRCATACTREG